MKRLLVLLSSISFVAGAACAPQVINEDAVLVAASPYFCRITSDQTNILSVYANEYRVFGEPQILKRPNLLPKDCASGNYLAVNFFVAGDVGGCGRAGIHIEASLYPLKTINLLYSGGLIEQEILTETSFHKNKAPKD